MSSIHALSSHQACLVRHRRSPLTGTARSQPKVGSRSIVCSVSDRFEDGPTMHRRDALLATAGCLLVADSLALPAKAENPSTTSFIGVDALSSFQRAAQKAQMQKRAELVLKDALTGADAPIAVRLLFNDAATYDVATKQGGVNGSIVIDEELNRSENQALKPFVSRLREVKKAIDEKSQAVGQSPISWADLIVLAGKVATEKAWFDTKVGRATTESGGRVIATQFSTQFPITLGRVDATTADPPGKVPLPDAPVEEIKLFLAGLGTKVTDSPSFLTPKPLFWERPGFLMWTAAALSPKEEEQRFADADKVYVGIKKAYDLSRGTVTRTDYEVDFIENYAKLANLGAKFDRNAYLYPIPVELPKKL